VQWNHGAYDKRRHPCGMRTGGSSSFSRAVAPQADKVKFVRVEKHCTKLRSFSVELFCLDAFLKCEVFVFLD